MKTNEFGKRIKSQIWNQVCDRVQDRAASRISDQVEVLITDSAWSHFWNLTANSVGNRALFQIVENWLRRNNEKK